MICILAHEGRFLETILKDGARSGVPRTRREPHRREVRTPTARPLWRGAGSRWRLRSHCREPASWVRIRKPPRWSAESVPVIPGWAHAQARVSRLASATETKECDCRRSIHPSSGGRNCCCRDGRWRQAPWACRRTRKRRRTRRRAQTRAQQRAAGTNNTALFDIVNTTTANGSLRAPRYRTSTRVSCASLRSPGTREYVSATASPSRSPVRHARSSESRRNRRRRRRDSRTR